MKIEAGKFYKTRGGNKARVYATDGGEGYPIHGAVSMPAGGHWRSATWSDDGLYYNITGQNASAIDRDWET